MQLDVSKALLIIANLLIPVSLLSFATGFFPYKPFLPGKADFDDSTIGYVIPPMFDKVIFMVVDALRRLAHKIRSHHTFLLSGVQRLCLFAQIRLQIHPKVCTDCP